MSVRSLPFYRQALEAVAEAQAIASKSCEARGGSRRLRPPISPGERALLHALIERAKTKAAL
jgi:hypothetical protein